MKNYACDACGMSIKNPVCGKCHCELVEKTIEKDGKKILVSECPQCHGKIKSPQCCGHDMQAK